MKLNNNQIDPVLFLKKYYDKSQPSCKFTAQDKDAGEKWQIKTTELLNQVIGFQDMPYVQPEMQILEEVDRGDHIRQKITIQTMPGKRLPVYLLFPKNVSGKIPAVLAFHGHGYGVKDIVGLWEDGSERYTPDGYHKDFAVELVRCGFVVAAPEIMSFGEHVPDTQRESKPCHAVGSWAMMVGGTVLGLRVLEAKRLVDFLAGDSRVDISRLGVMGISGGGMHTFFSACLDRRIKAAVISGYYSSWFDSILGTNHCICNFVPGILKLGDLPDFAALLAPRPVLVEAGTHDGIFPIDAVRRDVAKLRDVYGLWQAGDVVELDEFEGRHQISGARAYAFLEQHLR